jgi:tetratricopeptide (TPR) repeat protein
MMGKKRSIVLLLVLILCFPVFIFAETILLKSGKSVEGKLLEKADKYIKIDFQGVPLAYFFDDIESIDGVKRVSSLAEEKKPSQENNPSSASTETAGEYFNHGLVYRKQGNLPQAISDFTKAIAINPNYADAYCFRGFSTINNVTTVKPSLILIRSLK